MKKKDKNIKSKATQLLLTEEIAALNARLNFGGLPESDIAELSRMIELRKKAISKLREREDRHNEPFSGLLATEKIKTLREKHVAGPKADLLKFWLDGWPIKRPPVPVDSSDKKTGTHCFVHIFGPNTYPELLGRIIRYMDKIKKRGLNDYSLHILTWLKDWLNTKPGQPVPDSEKTADKLLGELNILRGFLAEIYDDVESCKIFLNLYGKHRDDFNYTSNISPDAKYCLEYGSNGLVKVLLLKDRSLVDFFVGTHRGIVKAGFTPDMREIIAENMDGTRTIWSTLQKVNGKMCHFHHIAWEKSKTLQDQSDALLLAKLLEFWFNDNSAKKTPPTFDDSF